MMKKLVLILLSLIVPLSFAFAGPGGESVGDSGYSLYYLPSNVANNQSVMVELTQAKSINISSLGTSYADAISSSYGNDNLVICCLMNTLKDGIQSGNVDLTITSSDAGGFFFIKDGNETVKIPFEIDVGVAVFYKGNNKTDYSDRLFRKKISASDPSLEISYTTTREVGNTISHHTETLNYSESANTLSLTSPNQYSLSISPTKYTNTLSTYKYSHRNDSNDDLPNLIKFYYISINLPENHQGIEEGLYTAAFTLNATFTEYNLKTETTSRITTNEIISVKGYVGEKPEMSDADYSFFLSPSVNTYFMDLAVEQGGDEPTYDIAKVQFSYTDIVTQKNDPASTNRRRAYTIYISPTNLYTASDDYEFIRNGTERQDRVFANTVEFDLLLQTSDGVYEYIRNSSDYTGNGNDAKSNAEAHFTKGKIGGAGLYQNTTNTFFLYPVYSSLLTSSVDDINKWKETWELDQHIYLRVKEDSKEISEGANARKHQEGMYKTTIYFTVISP